VYLGSNSTSTEPSLAFTLNFTRPPFITPAIAITVPHIIANSAVVTVTEPAVSPIAIIPVEAPAVKGIANEPNKAIAAPPIIAARLRLRLLRNGFAASPLHEIFG